MKKEDLELKYCLPFVEALESKNDFRSWVLSRTPFRDIASSSRLMLDEMIEKRPKANYYWRSFYTETCRCAGDCGQETDILFVFESNNSKFAIHFEVKHPTDKFEHGGRQAASYPVRAACWACSENGPKTLVPHERAATALLCSEKKLNKFAPNLVHFDTVFTFEEIYKNFPSVYPDFF